MASFNTTTSAVFIPEIWSREAQIQREANLYLAKRVDRFEVDFEGGGNVLHVPKVTDLTAQDIGSDGSLPDQANTEGTLSITVNKWKGVTFNIPDMLRTQAKLDLQSLYTEKAGFGLAKRIELDILGLIPSFTTNTAVGTSGTDLTDHTILLANQALDLALVPAEDRHMIVYPTQKRALLEIDKFTRADAIGLANGGPDSPIKTGAVGMIYAVEVLSSALVTSPSPTYNFMFHKSAIGLALVKDIKFEEFSRVQFATRYGASELYGYAIMRNDHGVQVLS